MRGLSRSSRWWWLAAGSAVSVAMVAGTGWLLTKDSTAKGSDIATVLSLPVAILSLLAAGVAIVIAVRQAPDRGLLPWVAPRSAGGVGGGGGRALEDETQRAAERDGQREDLPARNNVHQPTWEAVVPRQMPGAVRHFTGRVDELKVLSVLLEKAGPGRTVVISAINGTAGIGKTALAVYWAHQVAQQFPDGQLYVNLRGFDPSGSPVKPAAAIRDFLDAFAVPVDRIPGSLEAQAALYRSLLAERRVLVVLDNARDVDQVRSLLPGSPTCLVVVTSRSQLSGLTATEGAHPLALDLLTVAVARELLACHVGAERVAGEAEAVDELISLCARLPLALVIMGARASEHPGFPLKALVAQFRDAEGWRLDALDGHDLATNVRAVFSWSYRYLSAWTARMFRLLGVHPGPDISLPAAASMAAIPLEQARQLLSELIDAGMVTEHIPGRFAFHDLLRAYATDRAHTEDGDGKRLAAVHRLLDHYLHTAYCTPPPCCCIRPETHSPWPHLNPGRHRKNSRMRGRRWPRVFTSGV